METKKLDTLDNRIIRLLLEDGRMPIGNMAARLDVTAPTLRKRIKKVNRVLYPSTLL